MSIRLGFMPSYSVPNELNHTVEGGTEKDDGKARNKTFLKEGINEAEDEKRKRGNKRI